MGEATHISWADHTFNGWIGCTKVGPACDGCYADALMGQDGRYKRATWGGPGQRSVLSKTGASNWKLPLKWDREAAMAFRFDGSRRFVFCSSLADVFDKDAPVEWRAELFDLIRMTPNLTWLLLTKRPQNIVKLFAQSLARSPDDPDLRNHWPRNAAIGCTVVTQAEAVRDVPHLLWAKATLNPAFAFLSMEPLLEAVDLTRLRRPHREGYGAGYIDALRGWTRGAGHGYREFDADAAIDWVITGGETDQGGHEARPCDPQWVRGIRDQCAAAGVPFHHKQWGSWDSDALRFTDGEGRCPPPKYKVGAKRSGRTLDGVIHDARPEVRT